MHDVSGGNGDVAVGRQAGTARPGDVVDSLLDAMLQVSPDAAVIVDGDGRIRAINSLAAEMFGYQGAELSAQRLEVLLPSRLRGVHSAHRAHYLADPRHRPMGVGPEMFGLRKDGTEFPVDISLAPITRNGFGLVVAAIRDLTEQRRTERNAARLAAIVRAADDAILSTTADLRIESWNGAAERLFGYSAAEAIGQPVGLVVPEEQRADVTRRYDRAANGPAMPLFETEGRRKDGTHIAVAITISGIHDGNGEFVGYCEVVRDQTEHLRVQEQLAMAAADRAVFAERERIAHELQESVIHRIFAAGLSLGGLAGSLEPGAQRDRLNRAIEELDTATHEIRASIFAASRFSEPH